MSKVPPLILAAVLSACAFFHAPRSASAALDLSSWGNAHPTLPTPPNRVGDERCNNTFSDLTWQAASGSTSAFVPNNINCTSFFAGNVEMRDFRTRARVTVPIGGGDNDIIGFALGYNRDDLDNPNADYFVVDWAQGPPGHMILSRVVGSPSPASQGDWLITPSFSGVTVLGPAATLGTVGWVHGVTNTFEIVLTRTHLRVSVDTGSGLVPQFDLLASDLGLTEIDGGGLAFYDFSQANVTFDEVTTDPLVCGDGFPNTGEACDDGNVAGGDGCSATCAVEPGWVCTGEPSVCTIDCGDGTILGGEECDDGNETSGDGCSSTCICENTCGDGTVERPCEQCDRGAENGQPGSGCTSDCRVRGQCTGSHAECDSASDCPVGEGCCGNALQEIGEQCDDGNLQSGDCCSDSCQDELAGSCVPSVCAELGIYGPHVLPASEKVRLTDAKLDGTMEKWTKTGDFNLFSGQSVDPETERVVVAFSENDGANGRVELHRAALAASDCAPAASCFSANTAGTTWKHRDQRLLPDPSSACGFDGGTIQKKAGNKIKFQFKGKSDTADACSYSFPRPTGTVLREDIVIGDECATVLLDCQVFGGNRTYRCVPRP